MNKKVHPKQSRLSISWMPCVRVSPPPKSRQHLPRLRQSAGR
jgi:hypothetical protein